MQIAAIVMYPDGTTVDPGMVRQAIETYGVGSIYNHYYFVSSRGTGKPDKIFSQLHGFPILVVPGNILLKLTLFLKFHGRTNIIVR